jgi:hypothetical protein
LASFTVPSSVSTLGDSAFRECSKLATVTFECPSHLRKIPDRLFEHCTILAKVDLPDSVVEIAGSAFRSTSVTAPGCATANSLLLRPGAIVCCFGRPDSVRIPGSIREIGESAFAGVSSLVDLSFAEGLERIGISAFSPCEISRIEFPASLVVIGDFAFYRCYSLREVKFAAGSQLQCIGKDAFSDCRIDTAVLPANIRKIDPSAFSGKVWPIVKFDGPSRYLINENFVCLDVSLLRSFGDAYTVVIPPQIEVIGCNAFARSESRNVQFESGSRLREIEREAFFCAKLKQFAVPSSVEIIGDQCFKFCSRMEIITFEEVSRLKKIGKKAFAYCDVTSITIPASTEEIDGSAFLHSRLKEIRIAPESRNFVMRGYSLMTFDGTEIVRYFGSEREYVVPKNVEVLGKSCFASCYRLEKVAFENWSQLRKIDRSALCKCESLTSIAIPASVEMIEDSAFKKCAGLEYCEMDENAILERIGNNAFAECRLLRSFDIPGRVESIGEKCFRECPFLRRLRFQSSESLKKIAGNLPLEEVLDTLGLGLMSRIFNISVDDGMELEFPGWVLVSDSESPFIFVQDFQ